MIDHLSIDGQVINIVLWRNNLYQSITIGGLTLLVIFLILKILSKFDIRIEIINIRITSESHNSMNLFCLVIF